MQQDEDDGRTFYALVRFYRDFSAQKTAFDDAIGE
jgi:hypothetical protein